jgi:hypothetical protein
MAGVRGAGEADSCDPAGAQQTAQRICDLGRARAAGRGKAQAGRRGRVDDVQVRVHIQRADGQLRTAQVRYARPDILRRGSSAPART